jgi:membrane-bound lytic murein transglycosylase D
MKALVVLYTASLLLGYPSRQSPLPPQSDDLTSLSNRRLSVPPLETTPIKGAEERTDAAKPLIVKFEITGGDTSFALLEQISESARNTELETWTAHVEEAKETLKNIRHQTEWRDYTDWLSAQVEDMEVALGATNQAGVTFRPPPPPAPPTNVVDVPAVAPAQTIPLYDKWVERMMDRPPPARAKDLLPTLRAAFEAEGVPVELVWIAETESTFNPRARNPLGARGLFQIMPDTALSLGLSIGGRDQRLHPTASARAAARYLKRLHGRFGDWPLAIAAYNGGETRVARALKARGATTFASIAPHLPAETRLYVPKVLATVQVRTGLAPEELPAPTQGRAGA